jgi:hypothetical protein
MLPSKYRNDQVKDEELGGPYSIHENMNNAYKIFIGISSIVVKSYWKPQHL